MRVTPMKYLLINVTLAGTAVMVPSLRDPSPMITQPVISQSVNAPSTR